MKALSSLPRLCCSLLQPWPHIQVYWQGRFHLQGFIFLHNPLPNQGRVCFSRLSVRGASNLPALQTGLPLAHRTGVDA